MIRLILFAIVLVSSSDRHYEQISPAYAEVDCITGRYTGIRYRFDEEIIRIHLSGNPTQMRDLGYVKFGFCLYS